MSGGAYEYIYHKLQEVDVYTKNPTTQRLRFQILLQRVAHALHDIEWVDSGDFGPGDEDNAIDACFECIRSNL